MILEMDIGNTRCKWRFLAIDKSATGVDSCAVTEIQRCISLPDGTTAPRRIRIASVRGEDVERMVSSWAADRFGVKPEFAVAERCRAGLVNGYAEPHRLGVDRWLAMLAAFNETGKAVCVIQCGTAITVDLVDDSGQHRGGFIAPGLELMRRSLLHGTDRVRFDPKLEVNSVEPCLNTDDAVCHGTFAAAVGGIERACGALRIMCRSSRYVITGGDAQVIANALTLAVEHRPVLVLDGLGLAVP